MKQYVYYVSFAFPNGFGGIEIKISKPIKSFEQLESVRNKIEEIKSFKIVIINYQLLDKRKRG